MKKIGAEDFRPLTIGEIFDRAVRLVVASRIAIAWAGIIAFFLPRALCGFALDQISNEPGTLALRDAIYYARPCFDLVYAATLMLLFVSREDSTPTSIGTFVGAMLRNALTCAPCFVVVAGVCLIPFPQAIVRGLEEPSVLYNLPVFELHMLGIGIALVVFVVSTEVIMTTAVLTLMTLAIASGEAPAPITPATSDDSIGSIEPHEMIVPHVFIVLGAALKAMFSRALGNGQFVRTMKLSTGLVGAVFVYNSIHESIAVLFLHMHGPFLPTIWSSALLVPAYALLTATVYVYNDDARMRLEGLDIERALARLG